MTEGRGGKGRRGPGSIFYVDIGGPNSPGPQALCSYLNEGSIVTQNSSAIYFAVYFCNVSLLKILFTLVAPAW